MRGKTCGITKTIGRGRRVIIAAAMSETGIVPGSEILWESGHKDPLLDYHKEMNATIFEEWLAKKVLPALEPNSVLVLGKLKILEILHHQPFPKR